MYCNVVTAIDKIPTYLLRFNSFFPNTEVSTYFYFLYVLFTYSVLSHAFPCSYR